MYIICILLLLHELLGSLIIAKIFTNYFVVKNYNELLFEDIGISDQISLIVTMFGIGYRKIYDLKIMAEDLNSTIFVNIINKYICRMCISYNYKYEIRFWIMPVTKIICFIFQLSTDLSFPKSINLFWKFFGRLLKYVFIINLAALLVSRIELTILFELLTYSINFFFSNSLSSGVSDSKIHVPQKKKKIRTLVETNLARTSFKNGSFFSLATDGFKTFSIFLYGISTTSTRECIKLIAILSSSEISSDEIYLINL
ncbi:hypothetical protein AGLY_010910 [Aphis glycines]|uniref:Uncharacterized protein n=1 Tax=Aphis glycines TaxID=307491 RepID=A0A6G0TFI7_APHGL|nr:hypothetical protein AGLY_010910 [Aphis glycines]